MVTLPLTVVARTWPRASCTVMLSLTLLAFTSPLTLRMFMLPLAVEAEARPPRFSNRTLPLEEPAVAPGLETQPLEFVGHVP